jgi:hypothetical protein
MHHHQMQAFPDGVKTGTSLACGCCGEKPYGLRQIRGVGLGSDRKMRCSMRPKKILFYLLIVYALVTWGPRVVGQAVDSVSNQLDSNTSHTIAKEHLR